MNKAILTTLKSGTNSQIKALFLFNKETSDRLILKKFRIWSRWFFPKFFPSKDAPFHKTIDDRNIEVYKHGGSFLNIAFRGSAKTTRTKLFVAFAIANDLDHQRRYFKVNSKELGNAKQSTTDVYNMLISKRIKVIYPEIFEKTESKREETMASFTTATGVKMTADTIGTDQRGDIQDESRPDFVWFDDFETRMSLMSAQITHKIWQNMDEAITGLAKDGGIIYTCNYISERGNVHKLVQKVKNKIIVPIEENGVPTWDRYSKEDIEVIKHDVEDYEGDYLCKPSASKDVYFDRASVDRQQAKPVIEEIAGLKIYKHYDASHRLAGGHDIAAGVGLDSSTSVFIDFSFYPMQVAATYRNNEVSPEAFGYEIARQGKRYGECLVAPERNNYGHATIAILKQAYPPGKICKTHQIDTRILFKSPVEYGWETNGATKPKMISEFAKAVEDGIIELNDPDLIAECRSYTTGDLMDKEVDPRLATRHFDLLIAACIAFQMNPFVKAPLERQTYSARREQEVPNPAR